MNEIDKLRQEMTILEGMLQGVDQNIDHVAQRLANKAILSYPQSSNGDGLFEVHERLTTLADKIIDKMEDVHKKLVEAHEKRRNAK